MEIDVAELVEIFVKQYNLEKRKLDILGYGLTAKSATLNMLQRQQFSEISRIINTMEEFSEAVKKYDEGINKEVNKWS